LWLFYPALVRPRELFWVFADALCSASVLLRQQVILLRHCLHIEISFGCEVGEAFLRKIFEGWSVINNNLVQILLGGRQCLTIIHIHARYRLAQLLRLRRRLALPAFPWRSWTAGLAIPKSFHDRCVN
jgi:hypothetical protein